MILFFLLLCHSLKGDDVRCLMRAHDVFIRRELGELVQVPMQALAQSAAFSVAQMGLDFV